jgi:ABC-type transport system substrate-binding protein
LGKGRASGSIAQPALLAGGQAIPRRVVFKVVGDDNARVLQLSSGDLDLMIPVPPNQVDQITSSGGQIFSVPGTAVGFVTLNEKIKPLDEAPVRCALAHAVDRESIAKVVYFGRAKPAASIMPSSTFYYDAETNPIGYDLQKAKALLAKSSVPSGFEFTATVPSGNATRLSRLPKSGRVASADRRQHEDRAARDDDGARAL